MATVCLVGMCRGRGESFPKGDLRRNCALLRIFRYLCAPASARRRGRIAGGGRGLVASLQVCMSTAHGGGVVCVDGSKILDALP